MSPWQNSDPRVYFDANASERVRPQAHAALHDALGIDGNPASIHGEGRSARRIVERGRDAIGARFGLAGERVVFTSGGTESNALAIHGLGAGRRILRGATEHDAVRETCGPKAGIVPVLADGTVALDRLDAMLAGQPDALVCLMHANNETGVIHPIAQAAAICRRHGALLHVDAVQSAGRLAFSTASLGAASVAISAHKLGGLQGVGALLLADGIALDRPFFAGGGQERGRRGGTPATALIAAFGAAVMCDAPAGIGGLRDRIEHAAIALGAVAHGRAAPRLANTTCLGAPRGPDGRSRGATSQLIALDLAGFAVSAGAACSSGQVARSHVLAAMGVGDDAGDAIRVSLPWSATADEATRFIAAYAAMVASPPNPRFKAALSNATSPS